MRAPKYDRLVELGRTFDVPALMLVGEDELASLFAGFGDILADADEIIERILYLDGVPNLQRYNPVMVGENVPEQLRLELDTEKAAIDRYNRAVALCVAKGDNGTRELLADRLVDEEAHADWIESQLHVIATIGVENYLAQQLDD